MPKLGEKEWVELLKRIRNNDSTLTGLSLLIDQIGDVGAKELAQALQANRTLTYFNLWSNQIGDVGAKEFAQALQVNHTLINFDLGINQIGDAGAKELAKALQTNRMLTKLSLQGNQIGDVGAKELAQALQANHTLTELSLPCNEIGDVGAKELAQALQNNRTLANLDLGSNQIGDAGAKELAKALQVNHTLTNLWLEGNQIGDVEEKALEELLSRNEQLRDALHEAVRQNRLERVKGYVAQGVSLLSRTGEDENTPLHWAVVCSLPNIVAYLIAEMHQRGIPLTMRNKWEKTAMDLAQQQPQLLALFKENRAPAAPVVFASSSNAPTNKPLATMEISFHIARDELKLGDELGRGGFGVVFKGKFRYDDVAVKQLQATRLSADALAEFQHETQIMAKLHSSSIVRLMGVCAEQAPYYLVMEYMPKGDLYNLLHSSEQLSWEQRAGIALNIARGLAYLHLQKPSILHRDLKSKNILLDANLTAKLADFGLSKIKTETSLQSTNKIIGTLGWMAPEVMEGETYTLKADIYSYSIVLWELSSRKNPFEKANGNQMLIMTWVSKGKRDDIPPETPKKLAELMQLCWSQEAEKRPTANVVIEELMEQAIPSSKQEIEHQSFAYNASSAAYREELDSRDAQMSKLKLG